MVIRKREEYVVDGLGKVSEYTAINPHAAIDAKEPTSIYEGFAVIGAKVGGQIMQVPCEFRLDAATLTEAFEKFKTTAEARFQQIMADAQAEQERQNKKIVTAPAGAIPNIVMP
jgi:hypothetical protein